MHRNLVTHDVERNEDSVTIYGDLDFCAFRAFHQSDHTVLRSLVACNHTVIDLDDPVSLKQARLFRRSALHRTKYDSCVVRDIESNADTLEIAREFFLRFSKFHWREIDRVRIQFCQRSSHSCVCHSLHLDGIHIVLLHLLKDEVQLSPAVVVAVELLLGLYSLVHCKCSKHSQEDSKECHSYCIVKSSHSLFYLFDFHTGLAKKIHTVCQTVGISVHYPFYAGLNDQFRTFHTRGCSHVQGGILAVVS